MAQQVKMAFTLEDGVRAEFWATMLSDLLTHKGEGRTKAQRDALAFALHAGVIGVDVGDIVK